MPITSKPVLDVALMRAVLPVVIAISCEVLPAACTGVRVDCGFSPVNCLRVMVPPELATLIAAEGNVLVLWQLFDWFPAVLTER